MSYRVLIRRSAQRDLERLLMRDYQAMLDAIRALGQNPRPAGCKKLREREGWRIQSGDYRALYVIDDAGQTVTVFRVKHRREAYR